MLKTVILCKIVKIDYIKAIGCRYYRDTLSNAKYFVIYVMLNIM